MNLQDLEKDFGIAFKDDEHEFLWRITDEAIDSEVTEINLYKDYYISEYVIELNNKLFKTSIMHTIDGLEAISNPLEFEEVFPVKKTVIKYESKN